MQSKYHNYSVRELETEFERLEAVIKAASDQFDAVYEDAIFDQCCILLAYEQRGEPITVETPVLRRYKEIAEGRLAVGLVTRFNARKKLLDAMMRLPIELQEQLAKGDLIEVVTLNSTGEASTAHKPIRLILDREIVRIVGDGRLLTPEEQETILRADAIKAAAKPVKTGKPANFYVDGPDGLIRIDASSEDDAISAFKYNPLFSGEGVRLLRDITPTTIETPTVTWLYRYYDALGALLYVGISVDPARRGGQHQANAEWWSRKKRIEMEEFATRAEALEAERIAIETEKPLYNIRYAAAA